MRKHRIFSIIAAILVVAFCSATALAASYCWAMENAKFNWKQGPSITYTSATLEIDDDNDQITYEGVATGSNMSSSPADKRTFKVVLEKQGIFNLWFETGNTYIVEQHGRISYNSRTGRTVNGQYFKLYWSTNNAGGKYRVVLKEPTHRENVAFTGVYYYGTTF